MPTHALFPTLIHSARLQQRGWQSFNRQLLLECQQLAYDDTAGQRWSAKSYPGGYTSYNSVSRMHQMSPTFAMLERKLNRHVQSFARALHGSGRPRIARPIAGSTSCRSKWCIAGICTRSQPSAVPITCKHPEVRLA
jgi:hypothetical protein